VKLPNDKWKDYIPMCPLIPCPDDLPTENESDEEICSSIKEERDDENDGHSVESNATNSIDEFNIYEYDDIVAPTQPAIIELQLSTHRVSNSQETHIPGTLL
jgi:hypothetical protein